MRSDLPSPVRAAIAGATRPSLVFDTARIEANARAIAAAADGYTTLFAAKSFPHPVVRAICARSFDGFDVASTAELEDVGAARVISVADPTGRAGAAANAVRLIVACETLEQVAAAPARAEIAIRVSMSITGRDPAVGAVEASGHRRSRFGLDTRAQIAALRDAAGDRPVGLHVHHGPVAATSSERFIATARAVLALADFEPRFVDVGGAWHAVADLPRALAELRAAVPRSIELVIEPGRVVVEGAGFACGRVVVARELSDRPLRVVDLSRICHLRWSQVELVVEHPGVGASTLFVGPTCFEEDVLGEWIVEPPPVGAPIVLRNVSGYAVGWNTSFGGVPVADVLLV
jgi:diaminopimelate decarboxylase